MKRIIFAFAITLAFLPFEFYAQSSTDSLFFIYSIWNAQQRKVLLEQMHLTSSESSGFYRVYDSYNRAMAYIEIDNLHLLNRLGRNNGQLKQTEIIRINAALTQNAIEVARVRKQYFKKFRRVLSPSRVNQFMAFDESFRMVLHLSAQGNGTVIGASQAVIHATNARLQDWND
jgi:hypothetical protein